MRAVQITRFGGPEVLEIVDVPAPTPGPGQQLYDVSTAGINYADDARSSERAQRTDVIRRTSGRRQPCGGRRVIGQPVGGMFWLRANTLSGSQRRLSATSRCQVSSP
jgi:NADPH:quinone reductase